MFLVKQFRDVDVFACLQLFPLSLMGLDLMQQLVSVPVI